MTDVIEMKNFFKNTVENEKKATEWQKILENHESTRLLPDKEHSKLNSKKTNSPSKKRGGTLSRCFTQRTWRWKISTRRHLCPQPEGCASDSLGAS